ncbi:MAG: pseudouridine synthase, partial [Actinomycetota bacterium]
MAEERIQKALARAGFGSRRACEELIIEGRVTLEGRVVTLGDKVDVETQTVEVDGVDVNLDPSIRYYALHKPPGVVTTMSDPQGRPDIRGLLPAEGPRVFPVGRLDRDSEGLLVLTNDGDLANRLMHPSFGIEKEYLAEVEGTPTAKHLARLRAGVELEDGPARVLRA